ncbi:hypothetical protein CCR75_007830 [Bremia lactucae]|uniref:Uncharacterized protein n=1 Tax=Bremia lactucae TaxID=4779 RepID=A0A976FGU3_BRELC|nr:hypothetical protein CCR75_007830 [Bremia lactucae]
MKADLDNIIVLKPLRELVNAVTAAVQMEYSPASDDVVNAVIAAVLQVFQAEFAHLPLSHT